MNELLSFLSGFILYFAISTIIKIWRKSKNIDDYRRWSVLWYGVAKWMVKGTVENTCVYHIRYYPDKHSVVLFSQGKDAELHPYYNSTVMPMFFWAKRCVDIYNKESILEYIEKEVTKKAKGETVQPVNSIPDESDIDSLKRQIKEQLEAENYLEVKRLQSILDRLEDKNK